MRFDPADFIQVCHNAGIHLRREGPFLCLDSGRYWRENAPLIEVLRGHKEDIMPLLPDTCPQVDLFDPYK